jgi:DNA-binding beta-propeller fold protein YncE
MTSETARRYELADGWGRPPGRPAHLDVADVAVDARQRVLLLTRFPAAVLVYEPDGTLAATWGGDVLSDRPHSITAGPGGLVYVVDELDHAVKVFRDGGQLDRVIGTRGVPSDTGVDWTRPSFKEIQQSIRLGAPPFNAPTALAVGPDGELYVSDGYGNARIHQFSPAGELVRSWGEPGTGPGQFRVPHSVFAVADGRVFVADREGDRIQVFSPEGEYLAEWTDVQRPTAITADERGRLYVTELAWLAGDYSWRRGDISALRPARLTVFDDQGVILQRMATQGEGCLRGNLAAPHGVAVDADGSVYVAEVTHSFLGPHGHQPADCHTIQKFVPA